MPLIYSPGHWKSMINMEMTPGLLDHSTRKHPTRRICVHRRLMSCSERAHDSEIRELGHFRPMAENFNEFTAKTAENDLCGWFFSTIFPPLSAERCLLLDMELLPCAVLSVHFIACTSVRRDEFISAVIMSDIYWRWMSEMQAASRNPN